VGKKVIVSVINDLVTDQRVHKTCMTIASMGFDVLLVGRKLKNSLPMDTRPYRTHRMRLLFTKGALFYAEFNIRLFLFLLSHRFDVLTSNDLDTLLPNYIAGKIKGKPLIYDSHEYFTEVPELVNRPFVQRVWKFIEKSIFPKLTDVFTVNDSIADLFEKEYGKRPFVVRNIPYGGEIKKVSDRRDLGLPEAKFIFILQGAGINIHRGAEEMVDAMEYVDDAVLLIVGTGDVIEVLKEKARKTKLKGKIIFKPRQPYNQLMQYTVNSDMGLALDKPNNLNYKFSLPNKLFDYIRAGIPVLASDLIEIRNILKKYDIGDFIPGHSPENIAEKVNEIIKDKGKVENWKRNVIIASRELTWEREEQIIKRVYYNYV
jgi:glycosyltransferase involved in cell wall biosynthesis